MNVKTSFTQNAKNYGVLCNINDSAATVKLEIWNTQSETAAHFYISGDIDERILESEFVFGRPVSFELDRLGMIYNVQDAPYDSWPKQLQQGADYMMWRDHYARPVFSAVFN